MRHRKDKMGKETKVFTYGTLSCRIFEDGWLEIRQDAEQHQEEQIISVGKSDGARFKALKEAIEFMEETNS